MQRPDHRSIETDKAGPGSYRNAYTALYFIFIFIDSDKIAFDSNFIACY
jgi:hypothetical protein